ncbi:uncharacterized protein [Onthophagus taurus]|uniref:uncharacterized protein n=1 Tax=Onthophagus taurus TaxID=166361 RepID=UPI000C204E28|nr:uncharacterized protein LOC111419428 [Onthophagus taurus]XP_022910459.1 uncharacterized protein LOC111421521 [Onthophagus taurus]
MEPNKSLNENFMYNSMLARALILLVPPNERDLLRLWITKLHEVEETVENLRRRNEYMWFLLLMLQSKQLQMPFISAPPVGDLRDLRDLLATDVYEDVLTSTDLSWLDTIPLTSKEPTGPTKTYPRAPPAEFMKNQPIPFNGMICYLAAFSDHDF